MLPTRLSCGLHIPAQHPGAAGSMKDYFPVSMHRYSRYRQRLRASRTVHFPNDVVFQDHIRQGDLEQVGRFIRARKVTLDTIYPSGECCELRSVTASREQCGHSSAPGCSWQCVVVENKLFSFPREEFCPQRCQ